MSEITVKYLSEKEILEKEVRSWPTWSCEASEFPWEYIEQESCYILEGQVDITTDRWKNRIHWTRGFCCIPARTQM